jgi:hypothetical protein
VSTWFEQVTGFRELPYEQTQEHLQFEGKWLRNSVTGRRWGMGRLETPTLGELRARTATLRGNGSLRVSTIQGSVTDIHASPNSRDALIQAASQFNLLEMMHEGVSPEHGITDYEIDGTQGPACAMAAAAGTIFRNYLWNSPRAGGRPAIGRSTAWRVSGLRSETTAKDFGAW